MLQRVTTQLDSLEQKVDRMLEKRKKASGSKLPVLDALSPDPSATQDEASEPPGTGTILGDPKSKMSVRCDRITPEQLALIDDNPKVSDAVTHAKNLFDLIFKDELETRPMEVSASEHADDSKEHLNKTFLDGIRSKLGILLKVSISPTNLWL